MNDIRPHPPAGAGWLELTLECLRGVFRWPRGERSAGDAPAPAAPAAAPAKIRRAPQAGPVVAVPDPACEALRADIAAVEAKIVDLAARHAQMQHTLGQFQQAQLRSLGEILAECLRLRREHACLRAAASGAAEDAAAAERAAAEHEDYGHRRDAAGAPPPELDAQARAELKRLYRAAAMRCHPDRVDEAAKDAAQARFQRAVRAYRDHRLEDLRALLRELDADALEPAGAPPRASAATLREALSALRARAADLILAIQTLQLDADYRRARRPQGWEAYFAEARRGFEIECEALRAAIAALARSDA